MGRGGNILYSVQNTADTTRVINARQRLKEILAEPDVLKKWELFNQQDKSVVEQQVLKLEESVYQQVTAYLKTALQKITANIEKDFSQEIDFTVKPKLGTDKDALNIWKVVYEADQDKFEELLYAVKKTLSQAELSPDYPKQAAVLRENIYQQLTNYDLPQDLRDKFLELEKDYQTWTVKQFLSNQETELEQFLEDNNLQPEHSIYLVKNASSKTIHARRPKADFYSADSVTRIEHDVRLSRQTVCGQQIKDKLQPMSAKTQIDASNVPEKHKLCKTCFHNTSQQGILLRSPLTDKQQQTLLGPSLNHLTTRIVNKHADMFIASRPTIFNIQNKQDVIDLNKQERVLAPVRKEIAMRIQASLSATNSDKIISYLNQEGIQIPEEQKKIFSAQRDSSKARQVEVALAEMLLDKKKMDPYVPISDRAPKEDG